MDQPGQTQGEDENEEHDEEDDEEDEKDDGGEKKIMTTTTRRARRKRRGTLLPCVFKRSRYNPGPSGLVTTMACPRLSRLWETITHSQENELARLRKAITRPLRVAAMMRYSSKLTARKLRKRGGILNVQVSRGPKNPALHHQPK